MDFALEELLKHALRLTRAVPGSGYDCDGNLIGWEKSLEDKLNENGCDHLTYSMAKYYHYQKKGKKRFDEWLYFIPRLNSEEDDDERHDDLGFLRRTKILNYLLMLFCLFLIAFLFFFVFCWLPKPMKPCLPIHFRSGALAFGSQGTYRWNYTELKMYNFACEKNCERLRNLTFRPLTGGEGLVPWPVN